jgi:sterol desaturase/sphingolipid hydroxylase (fatty acid hydroxylase superfamily)
MDYLLIFLLWTFVVYWMHRAAHVIPFMRRFHMDHHKQVTNQTINGLSWKNAFLWFDSKESTIDQWLTEVIPTIVISSITGHWWLFVAYYIWAAFIQEAVEHNKKINLYPFITSGKWHLIHHDYPNKNYGVFFPVWDIVFGTRKKLDGNRTQLV